MTALEIGLELVVGFVLLFIVTRLLGKKQLSQITPFDFISALVLGELVGNAIYDDKVQIKSIITSIAIWVLLIWTVQWIEMKSLSLRGKLVGKPAIVISRGKLQYKAMKQNKLNIDELKNMLRTKDVFSIGEVEFAIFETNGTVSVMRKSPFEIPNRADLKLDTPSVHLPFTLISEGVVLDKNLKDSGHDLHWLNEELKMNGGHDVKDIFYGEWLEGTGWIIQTYQDVSAS